MRYAYEPTRPWYGLGPLQVASLTGRLSAETIQHLGDEASGPRGAFLPMPHTDGMDDTVNTLKADIAGLRGSVALVEGMGTGFEAGGAGRMNDWLVKRIGASPPDSMLMLMMEARGEVLAACGIPSVLFNRAQDSAAREGWRQYLHGTVAPLGRIVAAELSDKLGTEIGLDLDRVEGLRYHGPGEGVSKHGGRRHGRGEGREPGRADGCRRITAYSEVTA